MTITRRGFLQALVAAPAAPLVSNLPEDQGIAQNAAEASVETVYGVDAYGQTFAYKAQQEAALFTQMQSMGLNPLTPRTLTENPFTPTENAWPA